MSVDVPVRRARKGRWIMKDMFETVTACYFGLRVEVVLKMKMCSLIRFQGQEHIVDTEDLIFGGRLKCAA